MDKMREEFEAWANERGLDVDHIYVNGCFKCYCVSHTQSAFDIWKASRAAICVELNGIVFSRDKNGEGGLMLPERVFKAMDDSGVSYKLKNPHSTNSPASHSC